MKTLSISLANCKGKLPAPVMWSSEVFFVDSLNELLNNQSKYCWFVEPWKPCDNETCMYKDGSVQHCNISSELTMDVVRSDTKLFDMLLHMLAYILMLWYQIGGSPVTVLFWMFWVKKTIHLGIGFYKMVVTPLGLNSSGMMPMIKGSIWIHHKKFI